MDFKDVIISLSERASKLKESLQTEEATKTALVAPMIQALGYDFFNPLEVVPEFTCDIGTKKGEKVDYAIFKDGNPILLIECKHWKENLELHDNQLLRYFTVSKSKFGLLTNGLLYRFYTDLEEKNIMDKTPFLEIDVQNPTESQIEELKKFHKSYFDIDNILTSASELKYTRELKRVIDKEFREPSPEFVKLLSRQVYDGMMTSRVIEQFTEFTKRSIQQYIDEFVNDTLTSALKSRQKKEEPQEQIETPEPEKSQIFTTELELNAFYIVKSILRPVVSADRIQFSDSLNYFAINIDNTWKNVCRLYFNNEDNLRIAFRNEDKKEERFKLSALDDIYLYTERLIQTAKSILNQ